MYVDVATDLWGQKDNVRIFLNNGYPDSMDQFVKNIDAVYSEEMRRTMPPVHEDTPAVEVRSRESVARGGFRTTYVRVLVPKLESGEHSTPSTVVGDSSPPQQASDASDDAVWIPFTHIEQLKRSCGLNGSRVPQLFVFQAPNDYHSDSRGYIPLPRQVRSVPSTIHTTATQSVHTSPPRAASASHTAKRRSASPPASPPASPRRRSSQSRERDHANPVGSPLRYHVDDTEYVFRFLSDSPVATVSAEGILVRTASTHVLCRLMLSSGVDLSTWTDRRFWFLRSEHDARLHPNVSYCEFLFLAHEYPSLMTRLALVVSLQMRPITELTSPPRMSPSRMSPPKDVSPRHGGARSTTPTASSHSGAKLFEAKQRQACASERLYRGLSSIVTAKDRQMGLYEAGNEILNV